jgi:CBS-domain-containing membrane protein
MVSLTTPLDMALERMIKSNVRMLLVTEADGKIQGLITSRDIQGEKPMKILEKTGGTFRDLVVGDLMTLKSKLEVLMMGDVLRAKVGDIIATLKEVDRQHAIVVDTDPYTGELAVRGIFSLAQIGRQLGLEISPTQRATTFADLEWAMQHHS